MNFERRCSRRGYFYTFNQDAQPAWFCYYLFSASINDDPAIYIFFRALMDDLISGEVHVAKYLPPAQALRDKSDCNIVDRIKAGFVVIGEKIKDLTMELLDRLYIVINTDTTKYSLLPVESSQSLVQLEQILHERLNSEMDFAFAGIEKLKVDRRAVAEKLVPLMTPIEVYAPIEEIIKYGDRHQKLHQIHSRLKRKFLVVKKR